MIPKNILMSHFLKTIGIVLLFNKFLHQTVHFFKKLESFFLKLKRRLKPVCSVDALIY